ncbi:hypothetical protein BCR44DRAFT_1496508 [Catenaria anguillulae PL171]|uniref:Exportin-7/Ran-binding protein 17 TPR repeats domain-containing protein n=1 Tax=Catenaria anguillulae PL171 TaxID=765915 RepID=A0A1Y2I042_9FUNG|nr:hypothetical protein BCR44DRAFT_1496508 [Catenaria anguillulae PL171]
MSCAAPSRPSRPGTPSLPALAATGVDPASLALLSFTASTPLEAISQLCVVLDSTANNHTLVFAVDQLKLLVANHFSLLATPEKVQLKAYVINFVHSHAAAKPFVLSAFGQLLSLMIRLAWFESEAFTDIVDDLRPLINDNSIDKHNAAALVLYAIVSEMNSPTLNTTRIVKLRKAVIAFRDNQLAKVFQSGIGYLQRVLGNAISFSSPRQRIDYVQNGIKLLRASLSFDFIGTTPDESSDETASLQVPTSWRPMLDDTLIPLLFQTYSAFATASPPPPPSANQPNTVSEQDYINTSSQTMECISLVVSVRRSLFGDSERLVWIGAIMRHLALVARGSIGMGHQENYHEVCKTLARFKSMYNLSEMAKVGMPATSSSSSSSSPNADSSMSNAGSGSKRGSASSLLGEASMSDDVSAGNNATSTTPEFDEWMDAIARFSVAGLTSCDWSPNSDFIFFNSGQSAPPPPSPTMPTSTDPFDDDDTLITNLETLATFARRTYPELTDFVRAQFADVLTSYTRVTATSPRSATSPRTRSNSSSSASSTSQVQPLIHRLVYLTYVMAACAGARIPYQSPESHDRIDGELACLAVRSMHMHQVSAGHVVGGTFGAIMDNALLYFWTQFRKSYIGETGGRSSRCYDPLAAQFQIDDQEHAMGLVVQYLVGVLRGQPPRSVDCLHRAIRLFVDLSLGYTSVKYLVKTDVVKALMADHAFGFLDHYPKLRVDYYTVLSRILFIEDTTDAEFLKFVRPFDDKFGMLASVSSAADLRTPAARQVLVGLFKDLRGLLMSIGNKTAFAQFWSWMYPGKMALVRGVLEATVDDPDVAVAVLKFMHELAFNRTSRLVFENNSVNGILLFREVSQVVQVYAQSTVQVPAEVTARGGEEAYRRVYKGVTACMKMVRASFSGNYANFGVFALYGDDTLDSDLRAVSALTQRVPLEQLLTFPKLSIAFYEMIESLKGVISRATAANCIDNFASFLYNEQTLRARSRAMPSVLGAVPGSPGSPPPVHPVVQAFAQMPELVGYWLGLLLGVVLFEDSQFQWSLGQAVLPLIMLNQEYFESYCQQLVAAQLPERQEVVATLVRDLLKDVEFTLNSKMRERLVNNIGQFRREVGSNNITLIRPL